MDASDPRLVLDRLIRERGEDYASLSRLLGRNAAYVQQFIKRGIPRKLDEEDRRTLARYFAVPQSLLGGPPDADPSGVCVSAPSDPDICMIAFFDTGASAERGALVIDERAEARLPFRRTMIRELGCSSEDGLALLRVSGDSMAPTLDDGDLVMLDRRDAADRLRDGIYVLVHNGMFLVKRITINPVRRELSVRNDNPAYEGWICSDGEAPSVIGRVVWRSHRIP